MAEEPLVAVSDKLSSDIGHLQTKPRHREGYGVWVTQNSPAKWKKRPLNFQELECRRSWVTNPYFCVRTRDPWPARQSTMTPGGSTHTHGPVRLS
jgi:hypothetical protein